MTARRAPGEVPEPAPPAERVPRRVKALLFLLLWPTYGYFYQSVGDNEAARFDLARALVEDGVVWVDEYDFNSADLIEVERNGERHVYSGKAPGTSLLAAIPLRLWSLALRVLRLPEWLHWHMVAYLTTLFTVSLLSAVAALLTLEVLWRLTHSLAASLLSVLAVWLGSIAFPFSTLMFGHQLAAALLISSFAVLFRLRWEGAVSFKRPRLALGAAGLLAGFAVVTEYPTVLLVVLLSLYFLYVLRHLEMPRHRKLGLLGCYLAGGAIAAGILCTYNLAAFGELFYVPYQAYLEGREATLFPAHATGFLGISWPGVGGFLNVLSEITVRPQRGLLYIGIEEWRVYALNPVLWLALPGLILLLMRRGTRAEGLLVASITAALLILNACFGDSIVYWGGGASVGPRHLVPMLPFLALPLSLASRRFWWLLSPLLLVSVFYMLLATSVEPRVGYGFRNPARDLFASNYMAGRFALNRRGLFDRERRLITDDSVAFNLGKVAGLPGAWQLAPLMGWWLAVGGLLIRCVAPHSGDSGAPEAVEARSGLGARRERRFSSRPRGSVTIATAVLGGFVAFVVVTPLARQRLTAPRAGQAGLLGSYYPNPDWQGDPSYQRVDSQIDFDWRTPPWPLPPPFSIEWTGALQIDRAGRYAFSLQSDDGSILEIDDRLVVDNGGVHGVRSRSGSVYLSAGTHAVRIRYFNQLFGGRMRWLWDPPDGPLGPIPAKLIAPAGSEQFPPPDPGGED